MYTAQAGGCKASDPKEASSFVERETSRACRTIPDIVIRVVLRGIRRVRNERDEIQGRTFSGTSLVPRYCRYFFTVTFVLANLAVPAVRLVA